MARENGAKAQPRYYIQILCFLICAVSKINVISFILNINIDNENPIEVFAYRGRSLENSIGRYRIDF